MSPPCSNQTLVSSSPPDCRLLPAGDLLSTPLPLVLDIALAVVDERGQAIRRPIQQGVEQLAPRLLETHGKPMPWDVFELGLHCWRAAADEKMAVDEAVAIDAADEKP